jgi:F0F1-type ATP synthase assembly protein I
MASQPPLPPKRNAGFLQQFALAMELPIIMVGGVLIGGGLGYLADRSLHSSPALTLVGGLLGFAAGIWDIVKRLLRDEKKQGNGHGSG